MDNLEWRMYGLVPYNISPIQQGIQFGHALQEYNNYARRNPDVIQSKNLTNWAENWKTFIILNGGTTNDKMDNEGNYLGTLNNHSKELFENNISVSTFREPDLGDQLTAICFLVDERVFNKKDYPDFEDWAIENYSGLFNYNSESDMGLSAYQLASKIKNSTSEKDIEVYNKWVNIIGGKQNLFLRNFLKNFKLA